MHRICKFVQTAGCPGHKKEGFCTRSWKHFKPDICGGFPGTHSSRTVGLLTVQATRPACGPGFPLSFVHSPLQTGLWMFTQRVFVDLLVFFRSHIAWISLKLAISQLPLVLAFYLPELVLHTHTTTTKLQGNKMSTFNYSCYYS